MSQSHITLAVTVLGMMTYGIILMKNRKAIKADELLTFAMWCGAVVTGGYMIAAAFNLSRQPGQETNGLYVGIFGVYLVLLSIQKMHSMFRKLTSKPPAMPSPAEKLD